MFATKRLLGLITVVVLTSIFLSGQTQPPPADQSTPPAPLKVGDGVSAPREIYAPEPEYSDQARQAGYEGVCVLQLIVGTDGLPHNIRVTRYAGMGLDEKAIDAVKNWKFEPALRSGKPVAVEISVEVSFSSYGSPRKRSKISKLHDAANAGDLKAQLDLAQRYFDGKGVPKDPGYGMQLLKEAARQGSSRAQFLMGERLINYGNRGGEDYVEAYMWYSLAQRSGYKFKNELKDLEPRMSPDQLADARSRIDSWKPDSAK